MRRMNSRSPPLVITSLFLICLFLAYNYWTLFSQNKDLSKDIEKLQAEIKIEGVKQEQFDKKNQALQNNIHDLNEKSEKLQQKLGKEDLLLKDLEENTRKQEQEITRLQNIIKANEETKRDLEQQLEDKDSKIEELISDSQHILTLKNDAEEALAEKDAQINQLKMQLEQMKNELSSFKTKVDEKLKMELKQKIVNGPFNLPNIPNKEYTNHGSLQSISKADVNSKNPGLAGLQFHPGAEILPRQPSNVVKAKPNVSVAKLEEMLKESLNQIQQPLVKMDKIRDGEQDLMKDNNVLQNPPLDANDVHDDPVNVGDEPRRMDDDKNPPDILKDLGANPPELNVPAPKNMPLYQHNDQQNVIPEPPQKPKENLDNAIDEQEEDREDDQDEEGKEYEELFEEDRRANEPLFEANLDKNIRNIGARRHL